MRTRAFLTFGLLFAAACGSNPSEPTGSGGSGASSPSGSGAGSTGTGIPPGAQTYTVKFDPVTVQPGTERTQCVVKKLGNDEQIRVHQIHNVLPTGSHHLIVYRTSDTVEQPTPFDCEPFTDTLKPEKGSPLMVTQKHDELLTLPDGVGFTLQPGVMVRLEMHYINASGGPLDVSATSTFVTMPDADFKDEADFLFIGDAPFTIPANSSYTLGPSYLPLSTANAALADVNFFGITGHTHQYGKNVRVSTATSESDPGTPVYDVPNWQWSEPATVYHDPPFKLPTGGGFRFTCEWNNTSPNAVDFGESANSEMCFFWAYYYPSKGAFVCVHSTQFGANLCCPGGGQLCDYLTSQF
jgi:hypothetical protein